MVKEHLIKNSLVSNPTDKTVQTIDKYGSKLSTLAAIFLPYKVVCILFFQKNHFCHVQTAFAASSCVSILPISLNSCTQKLASPAFLPFTAWSWDVYMGQPVSCLAVLFLALFQVSYIQHPLLRLLYQT